MNFQQIDCLYKNGRALFTDGLEAHLVNSCEVTQYSYALIELVRTVRECQADGVWEEYTRLLQFLYRLFICSPVVFQDVLNTRREKLDVINARLKTSAGSYPEARDANNSLIKDAKRVMDLPENPLAKAVRLWGKKEAENQQILLIVPRRNILEASRAALGEVAKTWTISVPSEARNLEPYDCVVLFGPPFYLLREGNGHVVRSPLGKRMINFSMSYFPPLKIVPSLLVGERAFPAHYIGGLSSTPRDILTDPQLDLIMPERRDWKTLLKHAGNMSHDPERDLVAECKVVVLGGDKYVCLDIGAKRWKVVVKYNESGPTCEMITKEETQSLVEGDLIVLTTESSGDLLKPYADEVLGSEASVIHELQAAWKDKLVAYVRSVGIAQVVSALKERGASGSSVANVRNWCGSSNIAPENLEEDLGAILKLVSLDHQRQEVFEAVKKLRSARQTAGFLLQKSLLLLLKGRDLSPAFKQGFMDIRREEGGPTKTVFVIEDILDTVVNTPLYKVNMVQDLEEEDA